MYINEKIQENEFNIKLNEILRHIKKVEDNCNLLAKKLLQNKEIDYINKNLEFSLQLIQRGRTHDVFKLNSFEFINLNKESKLFKLALQQHHSKNSHHPEYYKIREKKVKEIYISDPSNKIEDWIETKSILLMSDLDIAEMVCDCFARSQEFGTDIKKWFFGNTEQDAPFKYNYSDKDLIFNKIKFYLDLLLTPGFN